MDGHDPAAGPARIGDWSGRAPAAWALSAGALRHASAFGWSATVDRLAKVYTGAMDEAAAARRNGPQGTTGAVRWEGDGIGHAAWVGAISRHGAGQCFGAAL